MLALWTVSKQNRACGNVAFDFSSQIRSQMMSALWFCEQAQPKSIRCSFCNCCTDAIGCNAEAMRIMMILGYQKCFSNSETLRDGMSMCADQDMKGPNGMHFKRG